MTGELNDTVQTTSFITNGETLEILIPALRTRFDDVEEQRNIGDVSTFFLFVHFAI